SNTSTANEKRKGYIDNFQRNKAVFQLQSAITSIKIDICCIINTGSFFETLGYGLHILHRPKSTNSRKDILLHSNWFTISMTGAEIMDIQVDGEIIEGTKRIEVTMIPGCLDVFSN
ncbi:MAG: hypothetical protein MUF15_14025, partial [Acidobacteria bacterium]|nr:hypothetical protein [Acidobacteriota bacterium]